MLPKPENYSIWPSVVLTGVPTKMTVTAEEKAFFFPEGEVYELKIIGVGGDEANLYNPSEFEALTVIAKDGVLQFEHMFQSEMEYLLILSKEGKSLQEMVIYALEDDLYQLLPFKGDFHAHSFRSDGKRDPSALAGHFREQGYDFFALTDHNRYYPGGEIDDTYAGIKMGLSHVSGEEVHCPTIPVHIVHVGGTKSVAEFYVHNREAYEKEVAKYVDAVPAEIPARYRERYGKVMWAADRIHEAGGMVIFPHPFWRSPLTRMNNVDVTLARLLLKSGRIDAYELMGAMGQTGRNLSLALWNDLRAEGYDIPVVGSSDVHTLEKSVEFPHLFTICLAEDTTSDSLICAVKKRNTIVVEGTGDEYNRHYRCYGTLRMVTYGQFLMKYYFPKMQRLSQGEGVAMRAYAMERAPAALVEYNATMAEDFRLRFFGRKEAQLPSQEMLDWESKWREVHLNGPETKAGVVYIENCAEWYKKKVARQI